MAGHDGAVPGAGAVAWSGLQEQLTGRPGFKEVVLDYWNVWGNDMER
jgi:hypothetical protein